MLYKWNFWLMVHYLLQQLQKSACFLKKQHTCLTSYCFLFMSQILEVRQHSHAELLSKNLPLISKSPSHKENSMQHRRKDNAKRAKYKSVSINYLPTYLPVWEVKEMWHSLFFCIFTFLRVVFLKLLYLHHLKLQ